MLKSFNRILALTPFFNFSVTSEKGNLSESETDSDVLFESRNKSTRFNNEAMRNGLAKASRNGFIKLGRRVKT